MHTHTHLSLNIHIYPIKLPGINYRCDFLSHNLKHCPNPGTVAFCFLTLILNSKELGLRVKGFI